MKITIFSLDLKQYVREKRKISMNIHILTYFANHSEEVNVVVFVNCELRKTIKSFVFFHSVVDKVPEIFWPTNFNTAL